MLRDVTSYRELDNFTKNIDKSYLFIFLNWKIFSEDRLPEVPPNSACLVADFI